LVNIVTGTIFVVIIAVAITIAVAVAITIATFAVAITIGITAAAVTIAIAVTAAAVTIAITIGITVAGSGFIGRSYNYDWFLLLLGSVCTRLGSSVQFLFLNFCVRFFRQWRLGNCNGSAVETLKGS